MYLCFMSFSSIILELIHYTMHPSLPERIYNPITAMGFWVLFTFQLDNTKR